VACVGLEVNVSGAERESEPPTGAGAASALVVAPETDRLPAWTEALAAVGFRLTHGRDFDTTYAADAGPAFRPFDLLILDWDLIQPPGCGHLDQLEQLELAGQTVLTSENLDEATCRIALSRGLYLLPKTHPASAMGFLARQIVDGAIRRPALTTGRSLVPLGAGVALDTFNRVLRAGCGTIELRRGEASVLGYLANRRGVWSSTQIIGRDVFGRSDRASRTLVWKYISELRQKLGIRSEVIESSRTRGYRLRTPP
jgi:DNA-binding response OmpR family regulator